MVLRPEAVRERLLKLEEVISRLDGLRRSARKNCGFRDEWAVERGLQLGAEIILDASNHILSAQFGVSAEDYEDVLRQLVKQGVIGDATGGRLKGLGGFRDVLVHGYLRVEPERVAEFLARAPQDFSDYARVVRGWLERVAG